MAVEVLDIDAQDVFELPAAGDEDSVEALASERADEALGVGVRARSLDRCSHDLDSLAAEHLVERAAELRVAIVDQNTRRMMFARHATT
jgi:hypothetical protein